MAVNLLKAFLPNRPLSLRIWSGPFRGARIVMNPRNSLRKIFGLYEHELNPWLKAVLPRVTRVVDVGANDGYFTFGCAAAFGRSGNGGEIIAIECQDQHVAKIRQSIAMQGRANVTFQVIQAYAGREDKPGYVTLDSLGKPGQQINALVKIDVEGAEVEVVEGGRKWMHPSNYFVIEVHEERFLRQLKEIFAVQGEALLQVNQRPVPILGRERRDLNNWWLVSDPGAKR